MTVGELRKKLEMYKDDVEIFTHTYCDLTCQDSFGDPFVMIEDVRVNKVRKTGHEYYTKWNAQTGAKQHTILVIS